MTMIEKLEQRKANLISKSENVTNVDELRSIMEQIQVINEDLSELRNAEIVNKGDKLPDERTAAVNEVETRDENPNFKPGRGFEKTDERGATDYTVTAEKREKAGKDLKENRTATSDFGITGELRAVTVGNGTTISVPNFYSPIINPDFPVVSSLVDAVDHLTLNGGESFRQPYVAGIVAGNYTSETGAAASAETSFDYADINRSKITAYAEITEELQKLPNANYADEVFKNIRTSMRMLMSKEILIGAGGTNQIVGIFDDNATAIDSDTDLAISTIDDKTLDEIIFRYGGNEEVEGSAVLILNKLDLLAFAKVRTATKQKFYDIRTVGNAGTINGIPFIINSACKSLTATSGTSEGDFCMAYGHLKNYKLVEFSPVEVKRSDDYKFKEGMSAFRGNVFIGGNVVRKNGFLRVKKTAGN